MVSTASSSSRREEHGGGDAERRAGCLSNPEQPQQMQRWARARPRGGAGGKSRAAFAARPVSGWPGSSGSRVAFVRVACCLSQGWGWVILALRKCSIEQVRSNIAERTVESRVQMSGVAPARLAADMAY